MKAPSAHQQRPRSRRVMLFTLPAAALITACTQNKALIQTTAGDHVWPAPPAPPRVRYIGEISGTLSGSNDQSTIQKLLFGPMPERSLITPSAVAVDATGNRAAIADPNGHCVHVLDLSTNKSVSIDKAGQVVLEAPIGVAWRGRLLFVSDPPRKSVEVFELHELQVDHLRTIGAGVFERPTGLSQNEQRDALYVCDSARHAVLVMDSNGTVVRTIGGPGSGPGQFRFPTNVACADDGDVAVADSMNFRVQRFSPDGQFTGAFGRKGDAAGDLALPKGIAIDGQGNVWVVDAQFENVQAFNPAGELLLAVGGEGHGPGEFWLPAGAFVDRQQRLWVADTYNRRVQVFQLMP